MDLLEQILGRAIGLSLLTGERLGRSFGAVVAVLLAFLAIPAAILLFG